MSQQRERANRGVYERISENGYQAETPKLATEIFGEYVFDESVMIERLPEDVYKKLKETMVDHAPLDPSVAEIVASTMKNWAIDHGATHFTHWFHPLTGSTAEKHDAFLVPRGDGEIIYQFSGKELTQGEPDASSFPSGGIRVTFEARGYTAWDPTSPAFIKKTKLGATLCIPTAFCSYTGEALDKKTPLLRSQEALSNSAVRMMKLIGDNDVKYVNTSVGLEQEYFLIDMGYYTQRPDLIACGRTLFGSDSYKGQSLDDHYFGSIKQRVIDFMQDCEQKLYKLGIPVKTRHNEVAPGQYEIAPVFENANLAVDHNMLIMEVMNDTAFSYGLKFLLHEKPFAGINGSGKHCNWSMSDSNGKNLLKPGKTPHENLKFMIFLTAILRGLDKYAPLMRMSVALQSNDHRLGANEAPPAVMSAFIGDELNTIVEAIVAGEKPGSKETSTITLGMGILPEIPKDTTDRNRTSPFAFTGNRFEFRALGSSQHAAKPVLVLNTIVAESLDFMSDRIEKKVSSGTTLEEAINETVREVLSDHQRIIFNGDNYTQEWQEEAKKRGLPNLVATPDAATCLLDKETIALFEKYQVLNHNEVQSRYTVKLEKYILRIDIELKAAIDIASTIILPVALDFQSKLSKGILATKEALGTLIPINNDTAPDERTKLLINVTKNVEKLSLSIGKLRDVLEKTPHDDILEHAMYYKQKAIPAMNEIRKYADRLELLVDDSMWPLPKYREMLLLL